MSLSQPSQNAQSKSKVFPIRFSEAERAELERRSGDMALGAYIKAELFSDSVKPRRGSRSPTKDNASLAQVLAMIGQSKVGDRLEILSTAVKNGSLFLNDEVVSDIQTACAEVHAMRSMLMKALGFQVATPSTTDTFNDVAKKKDQP
ncbi:MAG: hypothetical protein COB76_06980 [Alphaproteobacteria bacterium]|nr:MAG: hypothetical protein COB76_06980 [Alphaproteobacteria bacterium]